MLQLSGQGIELVLSNLDAAPLGGGANIVKEILLPIEAARVGELRRLVWGADGAGRVLRAHGQRPASDRHVAKPQLTFEEERA
ncbi:MAG: hypothetical protein M3Y55_17205 [Pseudomonadota bacterium]|nr:hypothetical protein [Pseudomonadota bacterium]